MQLYERARATALSAIRPQTFMQRVADDHPFILGVYTRREAPRSREPHAFLLEHRRQEDFQTRFKGSAPKRGRVQGDQQLTLIGWRTKHL